MADNNDAKIKIDVVAEADKSSADKAAKDLTNSVNKATDSGHIKVPVDLTVEIDKNNKELTRAQKSIVSELTKQSSKGFSASGKDIDALISKFNTFEKAFENTGKGKNNKIFREIRKQVDDLQKSFKTLQTEIKNTKVNNTKVKKSTTTKKTAEDRYLDKQEQYSQRAKGAGKRAELKKELDYVQENKSPIKSSGDIKASRTNDHLMRLSEYSAHGSNWADDLARTLKEEVAKAAKALVTYIDPSYAKSVKSGRATDEKTFLTDTVTKNVIPQLINSIKQSEAGDESITLDTLKEQAAVIKVLNNALGKTAEETDKMISGAIQSIYDYSEKKRIGGTWNEEGTEKGVGPNHKNTQKLISALYKSMKAWDDEIKADKIAKKMLLSKSTSSKNKKVSLSASDKYISQSKQSDDYKDLLNMLNSTTEKTFAEMRNITKATNNTTKATQTNTNFTKIGNTKEAVDSSNEQKIATDNKNINQDVADTTEEDSETGFNTDATAKKLIDAVNDDSTIELSGDTTTLLNSILAQITAILGILQPKKTKQYKISKKSNVNNSEEDYSQEMQAAYAEIEEAFAPISKALVPLQNSARKSIETPKAISKSEFNKISPKLMEQQIPYESQVEKSNIYATPIKQNIFDKLEKAFDDITGRTKKFGDALDATAEEQDKLAAERITTYGLNNGRNPTDTGDIANLIRRLETIRSNKAGIYTNPELQQQVKLTPGLDVDTTKLFEKINKTVLSPKEMRKAQMGGGYLRNIVGAGTAFLGMPSLEKSRSQAEIVNQVMANVRDAMQQVLDKITAKETELSGLEQSGQAKFDNEGNMTYGTSTAKKTLADLEEMKLVYESMVADVEHINEGIDKGWGNNIKKFIKNLSFTSPMLVKQNDLIRNGRAGLDKNGKALKFQTRTAEILNYTFQLIGRSIGQWFKSILSTINPIKQIKNLFSDFTSYDTKWQRTMNVIKYNLRSIFKPLMEKIAQIIVNIIGFIDIISVKIQKAFGYAGISLFDQAAADAEKIAEEMEAASNVTMGFDELHDIGTDNSGANDLLGDIYTPQLSQGWIDLANEIGDLFAGLITGDLGFSDVAKKILEILGGLLKQIGSAIWDWFKTTDLYTYITEHWKGILAAVLGIFLTWKLLKIGASTLFNSLFGGLATKVGSLFSNIGNGIVTALSSTKVGSAILGFGSGMLQGITDIFTGQGGLIKTLKYAFTYPNLISEMGGWGNMLGMIFSQSLLAVAGAALAGFSLYEGVKTVANNTDYNLGLATMTDKEDDKKSNAGAIALSAAGTALGTGLTALSITGNPLIAVIAGGIAGIATVVTENLVPSLEAAQVAAKNMNNELQSTSYYEGVVQGAQTEVDNLTDILELSNDTIDAQTTKIYDLGEKYGVSTSQLDSLVQSIKEGNYNTEMAAGLNDELITALDQLDYYYQTNEETTNKLTEAKKKLQKAELDLSIAEDVAAGNFEVAEARIEYAMASGLYTTDEAAQKIAQIMKETSYTEGEELLNNLSPELKAKWEEYTSTAGQGVEDINSWFETLSDDEVKQLLNSNNDELKKKWFQYAGTTDEGIHDLAKYYSTLSDEEKASFDQLAKDMGLSEDDVKKFCENSGGFFSQLGENIASIFSGIGTNIRETWERICNFIKGKGFKTNAQVDAQGQISTSIQAYATGTNYVPNDGLAYLHQGEAVIPKKYNQPYSASMSTEERNYMEKLMSTINTLDNTISQGINVNGEFRQKGSDLVATVNKVSNRQSNTVLNNKVYAR